MANPSVVPSQTNGTAASGLGDHARKPSVTISAAGASGYVANNGLVPPSSQRAQINFGQFNAASDGNAAVVNSSPMPATASLSASQANPRNITGGKSPSPIPQPQSSGGRPPSGFQTQNGPPNFGSMGGPENGAGPQVPGAPQGPSGISPGAQHLRRGSSHHSDMSNMSNPSMPYTPNTQRSGGYIRSGDRNRSYGGPGSYPQNMNSYSSPSTMHRTLPNQPRPAQGYPPQYAGQPNMPYGGSPHPPRSPSFQSGNSQPSTPHMHHQQMAQNQMYGYPQNGPPQYNAYHMNQPNHRDSYASQPQYHPQYGYFNAPYPMHPGYLGPQGPSPGPNNYGQMPPSAQQQQHQRQFNQASQNMSRTPSHASIDRPQSGMGNGPQASPAPSTPGPMRTHTPSQSVGGIPPNSNNFVKPKRESKAIPIKDISGNVVNIDKKASASPAVLKTPTPSASPAIPSPSSTPVSSHNRGDSKANNKTAEEIRADFMNSVKNTQTPIKEDEVAATPAKAEAEVPASGTTSADDSQSAKDQETAAAEAKAAEVKREREEAEAAQEKAEAEARAARAEEETREADAKAAKAAEEEAKANAEKAKQAQAEQQKAAEAKTAAEATKAAEPAKTQEPAEDAGKQLTAEEEEFERQIAEMEALEREEEEREKAYAAKKKKDAEEKAAREKAMAENADEELKRQEREAEAREEAREKEREKSSKEDTESADLFAALKKPEIGPGAEDSGRGTSPAPSEDSTAQPSSGKATPSGKAKPMPLKLDTAKSVEPPPPTPGMKSLKSARMLQIQTENIKYPEGIQSPNPALIQSGKRGGRVYDPGFLMQFQDVFKEKPSTDWEQKLKETIGDPNDPGTARTGRTPMSAKPPANRPPPPNMPMGAFGAGPGFGGRTLPPGTTSAERFGASNRANTMNNPLAGFAKPGAGFGMGIPMNVTRSTSGANMSHGATRSNTSRRGESKRQPNAKELEKQNKAMPLTASGDVKSLEVTKSGWKPMSLGQASSMAGPDPSGHMAPDMVQRKVKAALNKMTPERFDRITDQILEIAAQSKNESDGRTLRQVIALTFEKACDEAHWASMYARFCLRMLESMSMDIKDESIRDKNGQPVAGGGLFRKYLLNRCQEDFEQGWESNLPEKPEGEDGEVKMLSDEYYVAAAAKRKGLGLIQFIGELYKLRMLSAKIMHQCFQRLLNVEGTPDESTIESLVKLARTVGANMDAEQQGTQLMGAYFERIEKILKMPGLPSRMHFMLLDLVELRKSGWAGNEDKGPKTIQEIRDEAAAQQAAEAAKQAAARTGGGRNPSGRGDRNFSGGPMPPPDYPRNQVATDELRKLNMRQSSRQSSAASGPRTLGPTSMFSSRSASGRQGLGPGMKTGSMLNEARSTSNSARRDDATPQTPATPASANAFAALGEIGADDKTPASSPPSTRAQATETKS